MLENSFPLEVMLAHRAWQRMNAGRRHGEALSQFAKGDVEGFLVAVEVLVVKVRLFIKPHRQAERSPAPLFINHDLAALQLGTWGPLQTTIIPDSLGFLKLPVIRPKDRTRAPVLLRREQPFRVSHRHIVRIEQDYLPKGGMQNRVRFDFPSTENAGGVLLSHFKSIDAFDA